ncbi:MAG: MFS transporter [Gammaproteobacteria bacterium]|nr:MFS transporter [Gammaproteobacteria bacterium]MDH4311879.1 MFS transporter [Gammaproteobacteria bacterium]
MLDMQRKLSTPFLVLLTLPATAMGFALSVQISALSWILSTRYGLDLHDIGLVWAAGPLAGIVGQVLIGILSDEVWLWGGRRRPFLIIGGTLAALMLLALPSIGVISERLGTDGILGVAIAVAIALDLSINVSFNPARSLITDVTPEGAERTRGYTWMQTVSGSFGVLAYAIGAVFGNFALIYVGAAIVLLFSVLPVFAVTEPRELPRIAASGSERASISNVLRLIEPLWAFLLYDIVAMGLRLAGVTPAGYGLEIVFGALAAILIWRALAVRRQGSHVADDYADYRKVLAANSLSWIGMQTMFVYMIAFAQQRFPSLGADDVGKVLSTSFLALNAVAALLPALVLLPLARRFGEVRVHAASLATMAVAFGSIYLFARTPFVLYALMALLGIGWAAIVSLPFSIMSQRVEPARIGLYMGVFNLSIVLPQLVVSLGVGRFIGAATDKGLIFLIGAASMAFSAVAWRSVSARTRGRVEIPVIGGAH